MSTPNPSAGLIRQLRRLVPYLIRYRSKIILGIVFITISNVCSTTIPRVVGGTIDQLRAASVDQSEVTLHLLAILLLTIGSGFFMFATRRTIIIASRLIEEDLRNDLVDALRVQDQSFYQTRSTGSILAHASSDIGAVREFIGPAIMYSANTITTFTFAFSWMVMLHGWLTATIVVPIPFIAYATYTLGKRIHERYKVVQQQYEQITTHAQESFSGIRVVRAYAQEGEESQRFRDLSNAYYRQNMNLARVQALMMPAMTVLFNLTYVAVLGVGGWLISHEDLTVGQLTQFFIYLNQLLWPIAAIGWVTGMIQRGAASMTRLASIIDHAPLIRDESVSKATPHPITGAVRFEDVSLTLGGRPVLSNITLSVPAGSSIGIVGAVGAGKSSFVNLIPRLFDASGGTVFIDDVDVRSIPLHHLRGSIAVVPQESFLFSTSIRENVRFGRPDATDAEVLGAAAAAQLTNEVGAMPDGFDTIVGERGVTLSGGQKQRTALARAIASNPSILILDDALSAIDTHTEERIRRALEPIMKGRTTFIVAHRLSTVQHCNTIAVLAEGRIAEQGSHDELIARGGIYASMFARQQLEREVAA